MITLLHVLHGNPCGTFTCAESTINIPPSPLRGSMKQSWNCSGSKRAKTSPADSATDDDYEDFQEVVPFAAIYLGSSNAAKHSTMGAPTASTITIPPNSHQDNHGFIQTAKRLLDAIALGG